MTDVWETDYTKTFHHTPYPAISPTRPELSAANKTIFITGGGSGLGAGFVEAFATAGAAHIITIGRRLGHLDAVAARTRAAHPSTTITTISCDVTREADVAAAFARVKEIAPRGVDVVVANSGYLSEVEPVKAASGDAAADAAVTADWWRGWEVNVKGVYLVARHFLAAASGPGAVFLNISAAACMITPVLPGFSSYAPSKIGTCRFIETLQAENPQLRFHNIHPGCIKTDMLTKSKLEEIDLPLDDLELASHFLVWLASPEGEFLKGKYLWSNWDVDELKARKAEIQAPNKLVTGLVGWA
ncbi:Short chain dehydrogenase andI [Lasiodiplodia hormozganensis]|uniref:Short chain dehydrogenase andI n=1 Tax=Lasiodiplodia hormozganensis TaxID=869390 RepID=A0AA40D3D0_9PEZI|nr:Short chain dehydrogenase andI [Lasiodiplodia hormozganensis]